MKKTHVIATVFAVSLLAACTGSNSSADETPAPSQSASPEPTEEVATPSASETPSPEPTETANVAETSLLDVDGIWCPTSPSDWDEPCVVVDLPEVRHVRDDDPSHVEYVYPATAMSDDPRGFTDADYAFGPTMGECWGAGIDGYPSMSGAWLTFCPAGAASDLDWIDDPLNAADLGEIATEGEVFQDYTGQDRLYITQELTAYPYIRSAE